MNKLAGAIVLAMLGFFSISFAQQDCSPVLAPTIEQSQSDYSMMQSYMFLNAESEYDSLSKKSSSEREASASYKFFGAEYEDSSSKEEFSERIRNRLTREEFSMSVNEAKALHRRYLSEAQITGWTTCILANSNAGAVLLVPGDISNQGFTLQVIWNPQTGVGTGDLQLKIDGGSIDNKSELNLLLTGSQSIPFIVKPNNGSERIFITARIVGNSDVVTVPLFAPVVTPPKETTPCVARQIGSKHETYYSNYPPDTLGIETSLGISVRTHMNIDEECHVAIQYVAGARASNLRFPDRDHSPWVWVQVFDANGFPLLEEPVNTESMATVANCGGTENHSKQLGFISPEIASRVATFDIQLVPVNGVLCP